VKEFIRRLLVGLIRSSARESLRTLRSYTLPSTMILSFSFYDEELNAPLKFLI
jgi:hypothetical protein